MSKGAALPARSPPAAASEVALDPEDQSQPPGAPLPKVPAVPAGRNLTPTSASRPPTPGAVVEEVPDAGLADQKADDPAQIRLVGAGRGHQGQEAVGREVGPCR